MKKRIVQRRWTDWVESWQWYERYLPTSKPWIVAGPPINQDHHDKPPIRGRRFLQALTVVIAVVVALTVVWGIFH